MGKRQWMIAAVCAVVLAGGAGVWMSVARGRQPHGNIEQALKTDLKDYDDQQLMTMVEKLDLTGSTKQQRIDLFTRIKARFDAMPLALKLGMILSMRRVTLDHSNEALLNNGRLLMQAYWNQEIELYQKATPAQRQKMLDARIDEQEMYQDLQKWQDAAKSLFGGKPGPSEEELKQMRTEIVHAMVDAMTNGTPQDRAAGAQYFSDMQKRRSERGLPNPM